MKQLLALLLFVPSLCLAQVPTYVPADGLISWSSFTDSFQAGSGLGASAINHGAELATDRFGEPFSAIQLSRAETDWVELGDAGITGDEPRTISAWYQIPSSHVGGYIASLGPELFESGCNAGFHLEVHDGDCQFMGVGVGANCYQRRLPFPVADDGTWHHVVARYDSGGLSETSFWLDGILQEADGCLDGSFPSSLNTGSLFGFNLGKRNDDLGPTYFDGLIDDVGLWDRALTENEIQALYASEEVELPAYVPTEGLVAWYPLAEDGTDASPSALHATPIDVSFTPDSIQGNVALMNVAGNHILCPDEGDFDFTESFSIVGDFMVQSGFPTIPSGLHMILWNKNDSYELGLSESLEIMYALDNAPDNWTWIGTGIVLTSDTWHHIGFTWDGNTVSLAVDGEIQFEDDRYGTLGAASAPLRIGYRQPNTVDFSFYGRMANIGIYDRALNDFEIGSLAYGAPIQQGCTDPTACNYDAEATVDDGTCLLAGGFDLEDCLEVTEAGELVLTVPSSLSSFAWEDGSSSPSRPIGVGGQFILTATVGDLPAYGAPLEDGLVFHIDTATQEAYVATPTQVGDGAEFGCKFTITGAWGAAMGDGLTNTEAILTACADPTIAAAVASNVGPGWFLPSQAELDAIRTRLHDPGFGSYFTDNTHNWYWPSTECETSPDDAAGSMQFTDGFYAACNNKDSNPGGVIAAKRVPLDICFVSDTLFIASPCISATPEPSCGPGTVWDPVNEECIIAVPTDNDLDGCVSASDVLNLLSTFGTCPPVPEWPEEPTDTTWICGDPLTYWDYDYATVLIGDECWFAENLQVENYRTGASIPDLIIPSVWDTLSSGALSHFDSPELDNQLGRLYNWHAVNDPRGLCPSGWRIPTYDDAWYLGQIVGGFAEAGIALKAGPDDGYGWNGNNTFGFSALPGGVRGGPGIGDLGQRGFIWLSDDHQPDFTWAMNLWSGQDNLHLGIDWKQLGYSVRCLQD